MHLFEMHTNPATVFAKFANTHAFEQNYTL